MPGGKRAAMRVAIGSILQESNTFSPVFTRYEDFSPVFGREAYLRHAGKLTEMGGFIEVLEQADAAVQPLCAAWAITANRLRGPDFRRLLQDWDEAIRKVRANGLLLAMHGAQTAMGADDVEGKLLTIAREIVGPSVPIVVTLDLHANITKRMVDAADAIVGYQTYPHIDMFETGQKAARLMLRILSGECAPRMAYRKLPLIVPAENSQTGSGPMHKLMQAARDLEQKGRAEAVSIFPVQPWMDIHEMGAAVVAVTNDHPGGAERIADRLAARFWRSRRRFDVRLTPVPEAIRQALRIQAMPVVLSESSDSTGSGSPGDSTGVLKHLLRARLDAPAALFLVDPATVAAAFRAGVGATIERKMGGAFDRVYSKPVQVKAYVRLLSDGRWTARAKGYNTGITTSMGRAAVLEAGQVRILVAERPSMTVDPELFRSHGIEPMHCRMVVVKSPNGFRAAYEPIASKMFVVDTPGVSTAKLTRLKFRRIPRPMYPFDPDMIWD